MYLELNQYAILYEEYSMKNIKTKVVREEHPKSTEVEDEQKFDIILLSGDGSRYYVSRVSSNNKIKDKMDENDTTACVICLQYAKNHVVVPCGYLISCTRCTQ